MFFILLVTDTQCIFFSSKGGGAGLVRIINIQNIIAAAKYICIFSAIYD